jgi:hypothetical protein
MADGIELPACGLYRTTTPIAGIPGERLVYFHNHGDPGPGLYLPEEWSHNRAQFSRRGRTLQDLALAHSLEPLPPEGLYRVVQSFTCCAKQCRSYEPEMLVQLGYNATGQAILFVPTLTEAGLTFPERGHVLDTDRLVHLTELRVHSHLSHGHAQHTGTKPLH